MKMKNQFFAFHKLFDWRSKCACLLIVVGCCREHEEDVKLVEGKDSDSVDGNDGIRNDGNILSLADITKK